MKLLRLKINDPAGFRSLPCGFEHHFRTEWSLQDELAQANEFAPFVCAGPNGSGKSNLLEALAAIFFHLDCVHLENLPDTFRHDEQINPEGFRADRAIPDGFEIDYLIRPRDAFKIKGYGGRAYVRIVKEPTQAPKWFLLNHEDQDGPVELILGRTYSRQLLPDFVVGYSSGENEILSLPFFKMRFLQFDEYWNALARRLSYPGRPETRLAYLDSSFSQAILLCNLLFQDEEAPHPFRDEVGIDALQRFRIMIRRTIVISPEQVLAFADEDQSKHQSLADIVNENPALHAETGEQGTRYRLNIVRLLEGEENSSLMISALRRCATLSYEDDATDTLILDYWINGATKAAFRGNFDFATYKSPLGLFQTFQVLLTLNLYSVSESLKADLYRSGSHYVSETVPTLASDQRIMRFKFVRFSKVGVAKSLMLKELSDGEHQLLHSLGLCMLFRNTNTLFLLDEPETHFDPDWRASFISRLRECFKEPDGASREMLITTHSPFLISDSKPERVLLFKKEPTSGAVTITRPEYNTLGASINKITITSFGKRETVGGRAQSMFEDLRRRLDQGEDIPTLMEELDRKLGDSVEKVLLIKAMLSKENRTGGEVRD